MCVSFSQVLNIVWLYSLQAYGQCYCRCYSYSFSSLAVLAACFAGWNYLSLIVAWLTSFGICFVAVIVKCDSVFFFCDSSLSVSVTHITIMLLLWNGKSFTFDILCKIWSTAQSSWPVEKCVTGCNYLSLLAAWPKSVGICFVAASIGTTYRHTVCVLWLTSLSCHYSCMLTQHWSVRFQATQHFLIESLTMEPFMVQDSRLLYYLIKKIKTWLNINHITVYNKAYFIV